jgi:hypothetical protein
MKFFVFTLVLFNISCILAADKHYQELLKTELASQSQRVVYMYDYTAQTTREKRISDFPAYQQAELHQFLVKRFGNFYDGHHELIDEYIEFFTSQPNVNMRVLFGLFQTLEEDSPILTKGKYPWMRYLYLSRINLMPKEGNKNDYFSIGMHPLIASSFGIEITNFVDDRLAFTELINASKSYLTALEAKFNAPSVQLSALILGASTLKKAQLNSESSSSYWDLYPFLDHKERDFYPAMLAAAFVWSKRDEWGVKGYEFQPKWNVSKVIATDTVHFNQLTHVLSLEESAFHLFNARYYKKIVPPGQPVIIPMDKQQHFLLLKDSIYSFKRTELLPTSSDSCYVFYRTERGDFFRDLTYWFGTSLEEIKKLNGFTSNTLPKNWDVFFKVACSDSSFFAEFDKMSRNQKDAAAKGEKVISEKSVQENPAPQQQTADPSGKKITYTVKSGDSLWAIGQKHKVSDADIMKWNNIGTNIQPGQKLIIYLP